MTNLLRGTLAAALLATAPLVALAQPAASPSPARGGSAPAAKPTPYKSAFDGYRRFDDQKVQPWRDANDNVGRIGGWQAYAREAAGEEASSAPAVDHSQHKSTPATPSAPAASTPGPSPVPVKAPTPSKPASMPHDAYQGHGGHSMHKKP